MKKLFLLLLLVSGCEEKDAVNTLINYCAANSKYSQQCLDYAWRASDGQWLKTTFAHCCENKLSYGEFLKTKQEK